MQVAVRRDALRGHRGAHTGGEGEVPALDVHADGARLRVGTEAEGGAAARLTAGHEVQVGVGYFGGFHLGGEVHEGAFPSYRTMRRGMSVDFRHEYV